ncbi:MAG TPA: DUF3458 domain-containing protein, partial [Polyangiales bacterium]
WYSQAGTPRVRVQTHFDAVSGIYSLTLTQSCGPTPGQPDKQPFVIPIALGLLDAEGRELTSGMHVLTQAAETLTFPGYSSEPVPSLLRGFSAPVILEYDYSDRQLLTLLANDTDPFNRWEAAQRLATGRALTFIRGDLPVELDAPYVEAMRTVLRHPGLDAAFKELVLTLPAETYIAEQLDVVDPQRIHAVREAMRQQLSQALYADWEWAYEAHKDTGAYRPDPVSSGRRALAGLALTQLCLAARSSKDTVWPGKAYQRFKDASNMTDRFNALSALVISGHELAAKALQRFHAMFRNEPLVLDKWFALQAGAPDRNGNVLPVVRQLMQHPDFNIRN